jgi:hypothetical protein
LHPWLAGKISPAPEKSGDISALMYESLARNTSHFGPFFIAMVGVVGATVLANC